MKSKVISNKRNIFGIIKETVFGSMVDFFKTLGSTEADEMQEEAVTADIKAGVVRVEATTLEDKKDYVEVTAGKSVRFGGLNSYKRKVDTSKVVKAHEEKLKNSQEKVDDEKEKGAARTRGAR
jgi:class 3 adenylate cyclase